MLNIIFLAASVYAQCGTANQYTTINTQAGLAALSQCTKLAGSLSLSGSVSDLSPLSNLQSIDLSIDIYGTQISSLNGLGKLTTVGDKVFIHSNDKLTSLDGLNLQTVTGGVLVYDSTSLTSISGLSTLTAINPTNSNQYPFGLSIYNNPKLASLKGCENIKSIGNMLYISALPSLTSLAGLPSNILAKNITITNMAALTDISVLSTYKSDTAGCALDIENTKLLPSLKGLEGI